MRRSHATPDPLARLHRYVHAHRVYSPRWMHALFLRSRYGERN